MMNLSIIILNWNNKGVINDCLHSVFREIEKINAEVIIVDNGSTDGSLGLIKKSFPQVRLIENKENLMFAKANNQGFEIAKGNWVMTLGSDTVIQKGAIKKLLDCAERKESNPSLRANEESAAISKIIYVPQLISPKGSVLLSCRKIPTFWNLTKYFFYMLFVKRINPRSSFWGEYRMVDWDHDTERFVEQPEATCWLFCKDFVQEIGGLFDEDFPLYFNDVETAIRVENAGGKFRFIPDAKVVHFGGQSTKAWKSERLWKFREGLLRLLRKHYIHGVCGKMMYVVVLVMTKGWVVVKNLRKSSKGVYNISKLRD